MKTYINLIILLICSVSYAKYDINVYSGRLRDSIRVDSLRNAKLLKTDSNGKFYKDTRVDTASFSDSSVKAGTAYGFAHGVTPGTVPISATSSSFSNSPIFKTGKLLNIFKYDSTTLDTVIDDFNRTASPLDSGWTNCNNYGYQFSSSYGSASASGTCEAIHQGSFGSDQFSWANGGAATLQRFGVIIRSTGSSCADSGYYFVVTTSGKGRLYKKISGTFTAIDSTTGSSASHVYIWATVVGDTIKCYSFGLDPVNPVIVKYDASIAHGNPGIYGTTSSSINQWKGGSLGFQYVYSDSALKVNGLIRAGNIPAGTPDSVLVKKGDTVAVCKSSSIVPDSSVKTGILSTPGSGNLLASINGIADTSKYKISSTLVNNGKLYLDKDTLKSKGFTVWSDDSIHRATNGHLILTTIPHSRNTHFYFRAKGKCGQEPTEINLSAYLPSNSAATWYNAYGFNFMNPIDTLTPVQITQYNGYWCVWMTGNSTTDYGSTYLNFEIGTDSMFKYSYNDTAMPADGPGVVRSTVDVIEVVDSSVSSYQSVWSRKVNALSTNDIGIFDSLLLVWHKADSTIRYLDRGQLRALVDSVRIAGNIGTLDTLIGHKFKITKEGGYAIRLTNRTGAASVKGYLVSPSPTYDTACTLSIINIPDNIGVFYESGVANGSEAWVVISGIADVYFIGNTTRGYLARGFVTGDAGYVAGQVLAEALPTAPFASDKHFYEIGHVIQNRTGAGLARCVLHQN